MPLKLRDLRVGKIDGKHEYLTPVSERDKYIFDAYMIPDNIDPNKLNNRETFFIEGFRGTGKTSLLRWHAENQRSEGAITDFVLFKSDLTESQRIHISKEVGISWEDIDSKTMEIAQDFKAAWKWFILHKIGEALKAYPDISSEQTRGIASKATRLLGLDDVSIFKKAIGFMPKLEGSSVKIRSDLGFFEAELGGDFKLEGETGKTTLEALSQKAATLLSKLTFSRPIYIYFDELEAFYHSDDQHRRDQRMVRDLLFATATINEVFRDADAPVHIISAVRSEVITGMGSLGQEVDRLVYDHGFNIAWHHAKRSMEHPLIQMIARKIETSEKAAGVTPSKDVMSTYFPKSINGQALEAFILDRSFYKPRDIVWRLSLAQKHFPNELSFTDDVLLETETEYSSKLWDEVRYELSATYSDTEINNIEAVLSGASAQFEPHQIEARFRNHANGNTNLTSLLARRTVPEILSDLYRIGAIGNVFRVGSSGTDIRNRWLFRGDPTLLPDKRMELHPALRKRLSTTVKRKRSKPGGIRPKNNHA